MDKRHYNWSWFDYFWVQVDWGWSQSPCSNSWACAETGFIGCYYIAGFIAKEQMRLNCGVGEDSWKSLDCKEIQPAHSEGDQSWVFIGRTDAEAETAILWLPSAKNWLTGKDPDAGKDWRWEEKGDDRGWDGWMASPSQWTWVWVNSRSWWWTGRPGVLWSMGSQSLTWLSDWTELNWRLLILRRKFLFYSLPLSLPFTVSIWEDGC